MAKRKLFNQKKVVVNVQGIVQTNDYLLNESGYWQLIDNKAIRLDFLKRNKQSALFGIFENGLSVLTDADYKVYDEMRNGRGLYLIKQIPKLPVSVGAIQRNYIVENDILVGRTNFVIYEINSKYNTGESSQMAVSKFLIEPDLTDDFFSLPTNVECVICTNALVYGNIIAQINKSLLYSPSIKKQIQSYQKRSVAIRFVTITLMIAPLAFFGGYYLMQRRLKK